MDQAIELFLKKPPFTRFVYGFVFTSLVSLLWPITLYLACRKCPNGWEFFRTLLNNEQTYTTAHHLLFAPAVGLFLATLSQEVINSLTRSTKTVLVLMLALITLLAYQDVFYGIVGPYQLKNSCVALTTESQLRLRSLDQDAMFKTDLVAFQTLRTADGVRNTLSLINLNGVVSGLLTWLFLLFVTIFIWYAWASSLRATIVIHKHIQLILIAVLLIPWIPLRVYTDWYQDHWFTPNWIGAPAVFAMIIALLIVGFLSLSAVLAYVKEDKRSLVASIAGAIGAFVSFIFAVVPIWAPKVHPLLTPLWPSMTLAIWFVGMILVFACAKMFLR